jgi:molybdenum cofactor cytidylyltransferase
VSLAAVILAAGASRRMGSPKALLRFPGKAGLPAETFADRLIGVLRARCAPVIVVLGHDADRIAGSLTRRAEATLVVNTAHELGQLSSLQCGLSAVPETADGVMFTPVDHPGVAPSTVAALADAFEAAKPPLAIPVHAGKRGHPVCCSRELIREILGLPPGARASDVVHGHQSGAIYVNVEDSGVTEDIDDPAAYMSFLEAIRP